MQELVEYFQHNHHFSHNKWAFFLLIDSSCLVLLMLNHCRIFLCSHKPRTFTKDKANVQPRVSRVFKLSYIYSEILTLQPVAIVLHIMLLWHILFQVIWIFYIKVLLYSTTLSTNRVLRFCICSAQWTGTWSNIRLYISK